MMTVVLGRMGLQPNRMERDGTSYHYPMIHVSLATCMPHLFRVRQIEKSPLSFIFPVDCLVTANNNSTNVNNFVNSPLSRNSIFPPRKHWKETPRTYTQPKLDIAFRNIENKVSLQRNWKIKIVHLNFPSLREWNFYLQYFSVKKLHWNYFTEFWEGFVNEPRLKNINGSLGGNYSRATWSRAHEISYYSQLYKLWNASSYALFFRFARVTASRDDWRN